MNKSSLIKWGITLATFGAFYLLFRNLENRVVFVKKLAGVEVPK